MLQESNDDSTKKLVQNYIQENLPELYIKTLRLQGDEWKRKKMDVRGSYKLGCENARYDER
jgi:uncharacterized membrane protein YheB (UPF0754 family)